MQAILTGKLEIPLAVQLFGPFEVVIDGRPMPRLRTRKGQWLLALLALRQGRAVERDWLAGLLWPDSSESQALANLRLSLTDLRRVLGTEAVRLQSPSPRALAFDLNGATVDAAAFDSGIASGDPARVKQAVALYRGPLLQDCDEEWALPERAAREQAYLSALEKLAGQAREQSNPTSEAEFLRLVLATDPYRESALCGLMTACAAKGDYAAVTAAYRDFRLRLHQELHSQPDAATTALYRRLLDSRSSPASAVASVKPRISHAPLLSSFPNPLTPLLGREKETEELCVCLRDSRLVTLKGPGGAGKTRLAIALGRQLREQFDGQVWFVSLAELPDAERLPETVRDALRLQADHMEPFEQVINRLVAQPALLILDNYEHLITKGARFVRELLAAAPLLHCVVTSRSSLNLRGETEYRVQPLALPGRKESASRLMQFAGVQLFMERAAARRAGFQLTPDNAEAITEVCAKLEGIPLAIELVAAWSDALTPAQMITRLEKNFAFPASQCAEMPERHRSLQSAFDGSYALLDEAERLLLRRLSIFTGGWTLEAAEAICGEARCAEMERQAAHVEAGQQAKGMPAPCLIVLLKGLVEKSLVSFREEGREGSETPRYSLLEMTRQYAQERLSQTEQEETERRHADYYLQEAWRGETEIYANETIGAQQRRMLPDKENYMAACQRWQARDTDKALEMLLALSSCGMWAVTLQERDDWIKRLETQALPTPSPLQAALYLHVGSWALHRGLQVWALLMERAYTLAEGCGDKRTMADTLDYLAERDINSGDIAQARERLTLALEYAATAGSLVRAASIQYKLISLARAEKDFENAQWMSEALLLAGKGAGHWATTSRALLSLARLARERQDPSREREYLEQALAGYPETETLGRSNALRALGNLAARQGDYAAAQNYFTQSLVLCQESGDLGHEGWSYHGLADVAGRQGKAAEALAWEKQALRVFELCGEMWSMSVCLHVMARWSKGQPEQAAFLWSAYERLAQEGGYSISAEEREEADAAFASLQTALTEPVFTTIQTRCAALSWREIVRYAHSESCGD